MVNIHYPIVAAVNATAQTFVLGFAGAVLSWFKASTMQIFDAAGADSLGRLTMNLFLPALMFTTLVDDISDNDMNTFFEVLLYTTSR
jgi:predicted permease